MVLDRFETGFQVKLRGVFLMNGIYILECECVQNDKGIQCLMVGGHLNYCPNIWSMKRFKFTRIEQNFQP